MIKESEATQHPRVTYHSTFGGIGIGRLIEGKVYVSGGDGYYHEVKNLSTYKNDGGRAYFNVYREIGH